MVPPQKYEADPRRSRKVLEETVYVNLLKVSHVLNNEIERFFDSFDLTHRQYNVLRILYLRGDEGVPCRVIREQLVTNVSDVSRLIDRLIDKGLVRRERSENDRRVVLNYLTNDGRNRCQTVDEQIPDFHRRQFQHMDTKDIEQFNELLLSVLDRPSLTNGSD